MEELFLTLFNRSIAAGWLVLAVLLLRLLLRRAPKSCRVLLWGLVALRLVLPVNTLSPLSLLPSAQLLRPEMLYAAHPSISSGISALDGLVNPAFEKAFAPPELPVSVNPLQVWLYLGALFWLVGLGLMLLYLLLSALRLRRRVAEAVWLRDNIWLCEGIDSPFVLGLLRPAIYLPFGMDEEYMALVLAHEQGHILRHDHWLKPFGFLLLAVYWFNPLSWLAYLFFCRDIELACDEFVLRSQGEQVKKPYAAALLGCSTGESRFSACPVAFGEGGVKGRIKNILRYRSPSRVLLLVMVPLFALLSLCFLSNPA